MEVKSLGVKYKDRLGESEILRVLLQRYIYKAVMFWPQAVYKGSSKEPFQRKSEHTDALFWHCVREK